jgi:hypothetical protein
MSLATDFPVEPDRTGALTFSSQFSSLMLLWWVLPPTFLCHESSPSARHRLASVLPPLRAPGPPGLHGRERLPKSALARCCPGWPVRSTLHSSRLSASSCTATTCSSCCSALVAVQSCCSCLFVFANPGPTASNQYQFVCCPWLASRCPLPPLPQLLPPVQIRLLLLFFLAKYFGPAASNQYLFWILTGTLRETRNQH